MRAAATPSPTALPSCDGRSTSATADTDRVVEATIGMIDNDGQCAWASALGPVRLARAVAPSVRCTDCKWFPDYRRNGN
jgi:hypothetical protein